MTTLPFCPPQSQGPLVFSGSADGSVCVWEDLCSERDPLRLLHHWDATATGCRGHGGRLTLSPRGDRLFLAYGRANVKILNWRAGEECVFVCVCVCVFVCVVCVCVEIGRAHV